MTTVLVVDDHASNRELASDVLEYGGYTVIVACEGAEALDLAHAQHPDLVLTDILMPGMDGYQLARELRAALDTAQTPIVFYTANYLEAETRPFARACGVARVLLKSVDPHALLQAIGEVLAEGRTAAGQIDTDEADREHLHAVSAKLFEKATALHDTEARFRLMADSSPMGIVFGDRNGSANYVNSRLTAIMGLPAGELLGLGRLRCASDEHHDEILESARGRGFPGDTAAPPPPGLAGRRDATLAQCAHADPPRRGRRTLRVHRNSRRRDHPGRGRQATPGSRAVHESNNMLASTVEAHIRIVTHLDPELRLILAETTNIAQILLNLTINACHAMPDGGTLTIATSNVDITADHAEAAYLPVGHHARLTIRDTGHGMTPETLERAIEPFFTTKGAGNGSGLGLATVYGIITQLGGTLRIESSPGNGTGIIIHLPTTDQPVRTPPPAPAPAGGTETILVAEDEYGIRDTVTRTLRKAGYTVLAAANAVEALDLAEQHPHPIHLLLSDVVMPGMLGDELAARLTRPRPATDVLFMSGYAGDPMRQHGILEPGVTALAKPFTRNELLTAVRTAIGVSH